MIGLDLLTKSRRIRSGLTRIPPGYHAGAGAALIAASGLAAWLLGWPPTDGGAWRLASLPIALAAVAGWALLVMAFKLSRSPTPWPGAPKTPPSPLSYMDTALWRARVQLQRGAWCALYAAGIIILPAAVFDVVSPVLAGFIPDLPWFSITSHNLYAIALIVSDLGFWRFVAITAAVVLTIDVGIRGKTAAGRYGGVSLRAWETCSASSRYPASTSFYWRSTSRGILPSGTGSCCTQPLMPLRRQRYCCGRSTKSRCCGLRRHHGKQ